ncbi:MAG: hypothetical protein RML56_00635 [Burkholderiales bacterium]|nr:hypothetical protein [Burkholderiales bacterium]
MAAQLSDVSPKVTLSIEQEELRGIARTVAEIHWLLLILVLLFVVLGEPDKYVETAIVAGLLFYGALVMAFRYANFYRAETRGKIAIETWGMIAFVTWVLYHAGGLDSPLLNLYLLPVITAALTLGKWATLAEVMLIAACELFSARAFRPNASRRSRSSAGSPPRSRRCCSSPTS